MQPKSCQKTTPAKEKKYYCQFDQKYSQIQSYFIHQLATSPLWDTGSCDGKVLHFCCCWTNKLSIPCNNKDRECQQ